MRRITDCHAATTWHTHPRSTRTLEGISGLLSRSIEAIGYVLDAIDVVSRKGVTKRLESDSRDARLVRYIS